MRFIATEKTIIKSKDGREWGVLKGILENGTNYEFITAKEQFEALSIPDDVVLSKDDVKELFTEYKSCNVEFDQRGKVVSIS